MQTSQNGVFAQARLLSGGLSNALPFFVGGDRFASSAEHFQGRVDDVGLWTRALTEAEIAELGGQFGASPPLPNPPQQTAPWEPLTGPVAVTPNRFFRVLVTHR